MRAGFGWMRAVLRFFQPTTSSTDVSESDVSVDGGVVSCLVAGASLVLDTQLVVSHPGDGKASQVSFLLGWLLPPWWCRLVVRPVAEPATGHGCSLALHSIQCS